jgi:hypothetical protein
MAAAAAVDTIPHPGPAAFQSLEETAVAQVPLQFQVAAAR